MKYLQVSFKLLVIAGLLTSCSGENNENYNIIVDETDYITTESSADDYISTNVLKDYTGISGEDLLHQYSKIIDGADAESYSYYLFEAYKNDEFRFVKDVSEIISEVDYEEVCRMYIWENYFNKGIDGLEVLGKTYGNSHRTLNKEEQNVIEVINYVISEITEMN